ncbi:MAG: putative sulfate exporter family transporter [Anaeromyxobacter sp.]
MPALLRREDSWAILLALLLVAGGVVAFAAGAEGLFRRMALVWPGWSSDLGPLLAHLSAHPETPFLLGGLSLAVLTVADWALGGTPRRFAAGFAALFVASLVVTALGSNAVLKGWQLETPVIALLVGLAIGNLVRLPPWFTEALRTELYVKIGIVLMGATLPFTLVVRAGPTAILQATIVTLATFLTIHLAATRLFGLDPRFGATLGAGGSICGVSAAIAIGGAARAEKHHVSMAISLVVVWAVAMVLALPVAIRHLGIPPGPGGAWIGNSEFADAAGYAAAAALGDERAVKTFTLMKVIGRDMFVGVYALAVAFLSVTRWHPSPGGERAGAGEIWARFPKFIVGFFVASLLVTAILTALPSAAVPRFEADVLGPLKAGRNWAFTWTFLCIGFTTRFRELARAGWRPAAAFTLGVAVNVPLGWWLSTVVFAEHWLSIR